MEMVSSTCLIWCLWPISSDKGRESLSPSLSAQLIGLHRLRRLKAGDL